MASISAFSNGNVSLLVNMAKRGGLPWDFVASAELFRHYKPDPQTYLGAAELLSLSPAEVLVEEETVEGSVEPVDVEAALPPAPLVPLVDVEVCSTSEEQAARPAEVSARTAREVIKALFTPPDYTSSLARARRRDKHFRRSRPARSRDR